MLHGVESLSLLRVESSLFCFFPTWFPLVLVRSTMQQRAVGPAALLMASARGDYPTSSTHPLIQSLQSRASRFTTSDQSHAELRQLTFVLFM